MESEEIKERYKEKLLGVLKYCISFFDKHDLNWFIACGSAIGTVRHHGMIPWDDDIDIYMPRSDYNKLISIRDEMINDGFRFIYIKDIGYPYAFGKVMDDNTTMIQECRFPFNVGCYVDIFPLDLTDIGMMTFSKKWRPFRVVYSLYRAKLAKVSFATIRNDFKTRKFQSLKDISAKVLLSFKSKRQILKQIQDMENTWNKPSGDRYVSYTEAGMYMFPKEWFEDYIMMPFENIEVRVPSRYDEYLTYMYGDYMTPPPEDKRIGDGPHGKYYVNIEQNIKPLK